MYLMSMCFVHDVVVMLLAINMVPTLSTLIVTGYWRKMFMLHRSLTTKITSLTASNKAICFAFELESNTLFCNFNCQEIIMPSTCSINQLMLCLFTGSPASSQLLKKMILLEFSMDSILSPKFFVSKMYLITRRRSL